LASSQKQCNLDNLLELNVQIGRRPEALYVDTSGKKLRVVVVNAECTISDIRTFEEIFQEIPADGRHQEDVPISPA
jgi:hypothetical protein